MFHEWRHHDIETDDVKIDFSKWRLSYCHFKTDFASISTTSYVTSLYNTILICAACYVFIVEFLWSERAPLFTVVEIHAEYADNEEDHEQGDSHTRHCTWSREEQNDLTSTLSTTLYKDMLPRKKHQTL